jgi:hypothetical protein
MVRGNHISLVPDVPWPSTVVYFRQKSGGKKRGESEINPDCANDRGGPPFVASLAAYV